MFIERGLNLLIIYIGNAGLNKLGKKRKKKLCQWLVAASPSSTQTLTFPHKDHLSLKHQKLLEVGNCVLHTFF